MFGDLGRMMKLAGKIKTELPKLRERLAASEFTFEAGGGAVSATVNGRLEIVGVRIAPEAAAEADAEMLADLVKAAVAGAQARAAGAAAEALRELTGGMPLPGMEDMMP